MSRRTMDLRPEGVRRRVEEHRDRGLLVRCSIVGTLVLVAAWTTGAWRLETAKTHQRDAEKHATTVLAVERELAEVERSVEAIGVELAAWRSVTIPFGPTAVIDGILAGLPESVTLDRLEFDADSLVTTSGRALSSRSTDDAPARRITGELEGFAVTEVP